MQHKEERERFLVNSHLRSYIKRQDMMSSKELPGVLEQFLKARVDAAIIRAKANGRLTIRAHDF